jgi:acetolactate synthase I/II/III large subunit
MAKVDGGRLFAKALKNEGVETLFTLVGGHIMSIMYGCGEEGIKVIDVRHEMAGAYTVDAFARVTGRPGVIVTTAGPGVTDTVTAMAEALLQGVPVIHIGGASPLAENETGPLQDMNTLEIMSTVTKWARKIYDVARIPEYVAMAFRHAMAGTPGPVYLECAADTAPAGTGIDLWSSGNHRRRSRFYSRCVDSQQKTRSLLYRRRKFRVLSDGV